MRLKISEHFSSFVNRTLCPVYLYIVYFQAWGQSAHARLEQKARNSIIDVEAALLSANR